MPTKCQASTSTDPSAKPASSPKRDLIEASKDKVHLVQRGTHNENPLRYDYGGFNLVSPSNQEDLLASGSTASAAAAASPHQCYMAKLLPSLTALSRYALNADSQYVDFQGHHIGLDSNHPFADDGSLWETHDDIFYEVNSDGEYVDDRGCPVYDDHGHHASSHPDLLTTLFTVSASTGAAGSHSPADTSAVVEEEGEVILGFKSLTLDLLKSKDSTSAYVSTCFE